MDNIIIIIIFGTFVECTIRYFNTLQCKINMKRSEVYSIVGRAVLYALVQTGLLVNALILQVLWLLQLQLHHLDQVCLVCIFCLFSRSLILSRMVVDAFIIAFKRFLLWFLWVNRISAAPLIEIAWILVTGMLYHYFLITMMKNSSLLTLIATSICYNTEISKIFITIVRMFLYGRGYRSIRDRQIDLR